MRVQGLADERVCICSDPENCTQRVPGYRCKKDFMPTDKKLDPQEKAWIAVFSAIHRLRGLIEKDGSKLQVDFKVKGPPKAKGKRRDK